MRIALAAVAVVSSLTAPGTAAEQVFCGHKVVLDQQKKLVSWMTPRSHAYDRFLRLRWEFVKKSVPASPGPPPRSAYPQYYFYCAFRDRHGQLEPDTWMNDVGEKIPNWFESARLYYAYSGDASVMAIVKGLVDYALEHGTSETGFAWPGFPYTAANAGDLEFRGFTEHKRFVAHEVQVDHAGEMGLTYYRMFLYTGEEKYRKAALRVAEVLARNVRDGDASRSVWPYRVTLDSGRITAEYGANWTGCYLLLDSLVRANEGDVAAYRSACAKAREFLLRHPMQSGYWTDGHTDTAVSSHTYKSNLSASNAALLLLDHPDFDPDWRRDIPRLIRWTEDNFVLRSAPGEPSTMWGANIVGEQDDFLFKMDYQTARYGAECARWSALSGDLSYKEKAYRSLNWVTYCIDERGQAIESPVSKDISNWWSDCYGECPRMFYHAFAGVPEFAPPRENHILYSEAVLKEVSYAPREVRYTPTAREGVEYLRLAFRPARVTVGGVQLSPGAASGAGGYRLRDLGRGDFAVTVVRRRRGTVVVR